MHRKRLLFVCSFISVISLAQWNGSSENNLICNDAPLLNNISSEFKYFETIPDGNGGAFIAWHDARNGSYDVFVQRINGDGSIAWTANGVNVCNLAFGQQWPKMAADGSGGVVIVWADQLTGVSVQRLDNNGSPLWGANGMPVTVNPGGLAPDVLRNENGDFTVTWKDGRNGVIQVFAQRLDPNGVRLWGANGMIVCSQAVGTSSPFTPKIISDGTDGVIITWDDQRAGDRVYAQKVLLNGTVAWTIDGVQITNTTSGNPRICTDGIGGAIISWTDSRSGPGDVYAQRVNNVGTIAWTAGGVPVCTATGAQFWQQMTTDNNGGAIIAWLDKRDGLWWQLYTQRVNSSGAPLWEINGKNVTTDGGGFIHLATDGDDGAIITWAGLNIMAQHVSGDGTFNFGMTGMVVCDAPSSQGSPRIAAVGNGAGIISWIDQRDGNVAIYASRVGASSVLPVELLEFSGRRVNNIHRIQWKTASETNNLGFEIQRSANGIEFAAIGFVNGVGNTNGVSTYSFIDARPLQGKNYYRLKQIDVDHSFRHSKVILLNSTSKTSLQVFPNPAVSSVTVQTNGVGYVHIYDMSGKLMRKYFMNGNSTVIDVSKLNAGVYQCVDSEERVLFIKR